MTSAGRRSVATRLAAGAVVCGLIFVGCVALGAVRPAPAIARISSSEATPASGPSSTARAGADPASTRTVDRIVVALVGLAALILLVTLWFWRSTKPKPRWLEGLDALGSRRWRRATPEERARLLATVHERHGEVREEELIVPPEARPEPAPPPEPVIAELPAEMEPAPEPVASGDG
jgi:hypothetical protein